MGTSIVDGSISVNTYIEGVDKALFSSYLANHVKTVYIQKA